MTNQDERRNAILQAAFTIFGQKGYAKATMKEIAAQAGVAQGLIGYHFTTKETLLVEVVREWMLHRGMKDAFAKLDPLASPAELLQQALLHVVEFRKHNPEWFTLLISLWTESLNNEALAQELVKLYKEMKAGMLMVLEQLELPLNDAEKETLASVIQAVFDGLTLQAPMIISEQPISHEQISKGMQWLLDGVRASAQKGESNDE
ncbi:TetR/AcrR family transcriptional regulator [Paenibacillus daejeonensis]|uniref:TetR/AcrR family transcriptional regulator n=1 Tax=Paenibacillus daejeonensis TaxID=135193 RepID=UPI0003697833|nr:TetR/AcrR family transcriptional regulator [Paenibacillus daejeonensis]